MCERAETEINSHLSCRLNSLGAERAEDRRKLEAEPQYSVELECLPNTEQRGLGDQPVHGTNNPCAGERLGSVSMTAFPPDLDILSLLRCRERVGRDPRMEVEAVRSNLLRASKQSKFSARKQLRVRITGFTPTGLNSFDPTSANLGSGRCCTGERPRGDRRTRARDASRTCAAPRVHTSRGKKNVVHGSRSSAIFGNGSAHSAGVGCDSRLGSTRVGSDRSGRA